ncbi:DUF1573 domain-containing protein [Pseudochryseolinea flava]|uniref:DUF1573 domain-containing protein n=1 Tax=Pseudochryseolinea flava TaxID=2059302 RepID=A0A364Y937_9BACT|nr:DUF1573 domain-containing protein [Pseudochryseolinea flava]RAW03460.1 DUF1573 domain-containing protein [Pseudochryseolinea flava]
MKKIILALFVAAIALPAVAQQVASAKSSAVPSFAADNAVFAWVATTYDFGKIKHNAPVSHEFKFKNTGSIPLVISSVRASCGCTVADYTKEPIAPGAEGFVKATYNAANVGSFTKTVTVTANTAEGNVILTFKGEVIQ